jgi:hypothetical protein
LPSLISERGFGGAASIRLSSAFEVQADGGNFGKLSDLLRREDDGA